MMILEFERAVIAPCSQDQPPVDLSGTTNSLVIDRGTAPAPLSEAQQDIEFGLAKRQIIKL